MKRKRTYELSNEAQTIPLKRSKYIDMNLLFSDISVLTCFVTSLDEDNSDELLTAALSSPSILDILKFLDSGVLRKNSELVMIFRAIHAMILYGLNHMTSPNGHSAARRIAEGLLEDARLGACLHALRPSNNAEINKASLNLLAVVATASVDLSRSLIRSLQFGSNDVLKCSKRRNKTDANDVRSCFLNLIGAFVLHDKNVLLRELLDKKNILPLVINEMYIDKYNNVVLILQLLQKIAENRSISKTQKLYLFNKNALNKLIQLYSWRGEALTLQEATQKSELDVDVDQLHSIRNMLHKLLIFLFTSRWGILFSGGRRREADVPANGLILSALTCSSMDSAYLDPLRSELLVKTLTACPDIITPYMNHIAVLTQPRESSKSWRMVMSFVFQVYEACKVHLIQWLVNALHQWSNPLHVATFILCTCSLSTEMLPYITQALKFVNDSTVFDTARNLMSILHTNLLVIWTWLSLDEKSRDFDIPNLTELKTELWSQLRERIPNNDFLIQYQTTTTRKQFDETILADQTYLTRDSQESADVIQPNDKDVHLKPSVSLRDPQQDRRLLKQLPKDIRKILRIFNTDQVTVTDQDVLVKMTEAVASLPSILDRLFNDYFTLPPIHYSVARAIKLARLHSLPGIKPKRVLDRLISHPLFASVLLQHSVANSNHSTILGDDFKDETICSLLEDVNQFRLLKDNLLELVLQIAESRPKVCVQRIPVLWLLASYTCTLNVTDQKILRILFLMDLQSGNLLNKVNGVCNSPLVCGPVSKQYYQFNTQVVRTIKPSLHQPVLFHQPTLESIFDLWSEDKMLRTAINFPMQRVWLGHANASEAHLSPIAADQDELLDPCFVLHALDYYLAYYKNARLSGDVITKGSPDQFLRAFYANHCLAFIVAALSSYSTHIRTAGRHLLQLYHELAVQWEPSRRTDVKTSHGNKSSQVFPERIQIIFLLDTLRNSLATGGGSALGGGSRKRWMFHSQLDSGGRLTRLHANFFIRCLQLISKPEKHMNSLMWNCLLSKPAIDLSVVPDFLRNFFSTNVQSREERLWVTQLCADSLGDAADYLVLERSHVFKHFLCAFPAPSSDHTFQLLVLKLLCSATRHSRLVHALIRFHALPLWLWRHALPPCPTSHSELFLRIVQNMRTALTLKDGVESPASVILDLLFCQMRPEIAKDLSDFARFRLPEEEVDT